MINDEALELCNNRSNLEVSDLLFSGTGTIGETAIINEYPKNWNIKEGVYSLKVNKCILNPLFLRHLLNISGIKEKYRKMVVGGTVKSIPMKSLKTLSIPIPPLEEQERIVKILDKFEKIVNDINEGLPKEIELRQKQYEYYREKLLTFK